MSTRYLDLKVDLAFKRVFGELKRSTATAP